MLTNQPSKFLRRAAAAGNGLLNNLIAYWPLNEAAGANNALDLHSNALHLTQNSSPGSDTGKVYAGARTFNGAADYFTRASEAALQTGDIDFSLAAWVYPTAKSSYPFVFSRWGAAGSCEFGLLHDRDSNKYTFTVSPNGTAEVSVTSEAMILNVWALLCCWHDATANTINIQIDNGTVYSAAHATGVAITSVPFLIGDDNRHALNLQWTGRIGPVAMWKSAAGGGGVLSEAQRSALWAGGAGLAYAGFTA